MKKKFLLSLILGFCMFFMFGCADIEAGVKYVVQDGKAIIVQTINVVIDRETIENAGYDYDNSISQLIARTNTFMKEKEDSYSSFLREIAVNETKYAKSINKRFYNSLETFSYLNYYTLTETITGFKVEKQFGNIYSFMVFNDYNMFYVGCPNCQNEIDINTDLWEANHTNGVENSHTCPSCKEVIHDYQYYFESRLVDIPLDGNLTIEKNSFVTSYLQECSTMFSNVNNLTFKDGRRLIDFLASVFRGGNENFNLEDANLIYKFITPYKRVHSNGTTTKEGNYYVHTWNITDPDSTIFLSRSVTNTTMWYVISLSSAVGIMVVYFVSRFIYKTVKKRKYNKYNHPPHVEKEDNKKEKNNNLIDIIRR